MVALITIIVVVIVYGVVVAVGKIWSEDKAATASPTPNQIAVQDFSLDTDRDGLPNVVESLYHTDPSKADTDGDGTSDGEEVSAGRDPLNSTSEDAIRDIITGDTVAKQNTYTAKYLATLPTDLAREEILNKERVQAFVEQEKGSLLTPVTDADIRLTSGAGKDAVSTYLDSISSTHNSAIKDVSSSDIEAAYQAFYASPQTSSALADIEKVLINNVTTLKTVSVPTETKEIHKKLLAASQALVDSVKLLAITPTDFIGGLIGAKKIEDLGPVFQEIGSEISALEKTYNL